MLLKAKEYLQNKKRVSVQQLANHLGCQRSAVEPMLNILVQRGNCRSLGTNKLAAIPVQSANSGCAKPCGLGCGKKQSAAAPLDNSSPNIYYQWLSA